MSEDCLYLSIFSPTIQGQQNAGGKGKGFAVMVFLHGDSYSWGSAALYDAKVLATLGNIIVVTFNYRIGLLGYLNPNPAPERRGSVSNYGLVDQLAALQWVQENIQEFGGDKERITLVGQGRGAASVEFLVHSLMVRQTHFKRVVLMSGSIFSPWARVENPSEVAVRVARQLGCPIPADLNMHHSTILQCLRSKPLDDLLSVDLGPTLSFLSNIGPSFDGVTIKKNFVNIRGKRSFESRTYDSLIGVSSTDWVHELGENMLQEGLDTEQRDEILRTLVINNYEARYREIFLAVSNQYTDLNQDPTAKMRLRNLTLNAVSDALYAAPAIHSAGTFLRRKNSTYFYNWNHGTRNGMYPQGTGIDGSYGQELDYLFGVPICNTWRHQEYKYTRGEAILSAVMITYFSNFVKTGNPNSPATVEDLIKTRNDAKRNKMVVWEPFDSQRRYLNLDVRPEMKENFKPNEMALWLRLVPQLELTGTSSNPGHSQLVGSTWGTARNLTSSPGVQQMSLGDVSACEDAKQASKYSKVYTVGIVFGSILVAANTVIIVCVYYKRQNNRTRWEREARGVSTECLNNSVLEPQAVPSFSTPGRTATLRRQTHQQPDRQNVPLVTFDDQSVPNYKLKTTDSSSYKVCSSVPLLTDIPAPRQFVDKVRGETSYREEDTITC